MKQALIVAHDHISPPGPLGDRLVERGFDLHDFVVVEGERFDRPDVSVTYPSFLDFDVVLLLGAPWSVYDPTIQPWFMQETLELQGADREGLGVLGVCFGGQALASSLGGSVERSPLPEIGWCHVESDDEGLIPGGDWFQFHFDRWETPKDATMLATSVLANQAFVLRRNLAVQFHPELNYSTLQGWFENGGDAVVEEWGHSPDYLLQETMNKEAESARKAAQLVDNFLDKVASA